MVDRPLHALCVVYLRRSADTLLPDAHCPVPPAAHELHTRRAPVARHHRRDVTLVYLRWLRERAHVKRVEVVVLRREEDGGRERG